MIAADLTTRRRWIALAVLMLPTMLIAIDATVLGFAIPKLSESLDPSSSELLWIVDIYSFVLAGLLVTMGNLGDRIGRRRLLLIGGGAFGVASVLCALATGPGALIAGRAVLGLAGATLMPSTLSLIRNIFPDDRERQTAIAVWAAGFSVGGALGPVIGGVLLDHYWWGSVFLLAVPVTVVFLASAPALVPESADPDPGPFDLPSAALSMLAMFPLVFALKQLAEQGISVLVVASALAGVGGGVLFARRQRRLAHPMLDLDLFRLRGFRMAVAGNLVALIGVAGSNFFVTQHLQLIGRISPSRAGVLLLPVSAVALLCTLGAPTVARRIGAFSSIAWGMAIGGAGFVWLAQLRPDAGLWVPIGAATLIYPGVTLAMVVAIDGIMSAIPPERAGAGAAVSETANELGIALGTALLGSVMVAVYRRDLHAVPGVSAAAIDAARDTLGTADLTATRLGGQGGALLRDAASRAFVHGVEVASWCAVALCLAVAVWAWRLRTAGGEAAE